MSAGRFSLRLRPALAVQMGFDGSSHSRGVQVSTQEGGDLLCCGQRAFDYIPVLKIEDLEIGILRKPLAHLGQLFSE